MPGRTKADGLQFLRSVAGGSTAGTGTTFMRDLEMLRLDYNTQVSMMDAKITVMRAEGKAPAEIAQWAVAERLRIARSIRWRQNPGAVVSLEMRDYYQYGFGGRSLGNLSRRVLNSNKVLEPKFSLNETLIKASMRPNEAVTGGAARAAEYLRFGGPILLTLGAGLSIYNVESAAPEDRGRVAAEEGGSWLGGWILSGAAVALCLVLAPETGGLSLAGIGFVAGIAGGVGGSMAADKIYYSSHAHLIPSMRQTGVIHPGMMQSSMPHPPVACPRCHS
ncbi:hypothetical protein [Granulicella arctica]|uniref:Uncharacterized protein n=1 Tax=Granulicella arctica TaxID=940613 RepID=A0A7Y9PF62_9BACT|nr:hypothetical protein [Granulicella arctica]NYF78802.1 hypothetical protein [Granulicella arctica]